MAPPRLLASVGGLAVALFCLLGQFQAHQQPNYRAALANALLYFEGQRSGKLPPDQRVQWRGDSALADGRDHGVRTKHLRRRRCCTSFTPAFPSMTN